MVVCSGSLVFLFLFIHFEWYQVLYLSHICIWIALLLLMSAHVQFWFLYFLCVKVDFLYFLVLFHVINVKTSLSWIGETGGVSSLLFSGTYEAAGVLFTHQLSLWAGVNLLESHHYYLQVHIKHYWRALNGYLFCFRCSC